MMQSGGFNWHYTIITNDKNMHVNIIPLDFGGCWNCKMIQANAYAEMKMSTEDVQKKESNSKNLIK